MALCARSEAPWHVVSWLVEEAGGAVELASGDVPAFVQPELLEKAFPPGTLPVPQPELEEQATAIEAAEDDFTRLVTVLDDEYPANLRAVYDRPPFLWVRGRIEPEDARALAVVGTRTASSEGLEQAGHLAQALAARGVTVVSGLARGIDTAAHEGALAAGGRTIAVMGTGIDLVYPRENAELAERIVARGGALVSQFPPKAPPTRFRFPLRNRTMSGLALGTVVVEASHTSGARMQARIAVEHGKRVFLVQELVTREAWTRRYIGHPAATVVERVDDVLAVLDELERLEPAAKQLTIA
jgi:DNA processing protein